MFFPNKSLCRVVLLAPFVAWAGSVSAVGLGELRGISALGEPFAAEIDVIVAAGEILDSSCFRVRQPVSDDGLPWLHQARLTFRKAPAPALLVRSHAPQNDPVLQVGIVVGCGHEVRRDYTVFLSPSLGRGDAPQRPGEAPVAAPPPDGEARPAAPRRERTVRDVVPPRPPRERAPRRPPVPVDRLVLSGGGGGEEGALRLATELASWRERDGQDVETRRELLRLEFRTLLALNEQADSQLAASERLRNLEANLAELQQRTAEIAQRMEPPGGNLPAPGAAAAPAPAPEPVPVAPTPAAPAKPAARPVEASSSTLSEWGFYGLILAAALAVAGWLGWRQYRKRGEAMETLPPLDVPEPMIDPRRDSEFDEPGGVDLAVEPAAMGMPLQVDVPLDDAPVPPPQPRPLESQFSVSAATVDEHFEANPVMELAEIMLSFGRVKGAAQALQDFIDNNPQEALQPWIKLLDVYRMAGMQEEFQRVAENLNKHFNVEVQHWDLGQPALIPAEDNGLSLVPRGEDGVSKALTIEDLPHVVEALAGQWRSPEVLDYLHHLLRDNRGGKRSGFTLEVVHEILFLIELRETMLVMDKEAGEQTGGK